MSVSALSFAQIQGLTPATALPAASSEQIGRIRRTSHEFEAQLMGQMLQPMFDGLSSDGEFDGGQAEGTYRTFMVDAIGKQMSNRGGIGVAHAVEREMLKMQGLSDPSFAEASVGGPSPAVMQAYGGPVLRSSGRSAAG